MRTKPAMNLTDAKEMIAAAQAEAVKNNWNVSVAIVDEGGVLIALERMDGAFVQSTELATKKAWTSAMLRMPTKQAEDMIKDRPALVMFPGQLRVQGGLPIKVGSDCVGAIGVSGVMSHQDEQCAAAGLAVLKTS